MIAADKRNAVFLLHEAGTSARQIARQLSLSRKAVHAIIRQRGQMPAAARPVKVRLDPELLRKLVHECNGWIQRVHEKLQEQHGLAVKYSTLTRTLRQLGIGRNTEPRCARVPDEPGLEMQHDTSVYTLRLREQSVRVVASLIYLRYSKRRYLRFYRAFNRFKMKGFLHRALMHWGYAAGRCIIDNTNLARYVGTGARAIIAPEMEAFARERGFVFVCHEIGHSDRKAGEERSFWFVETNFFPGRSFESLEDLNQQALDWATVRLEHRPQGKAQLIPAKAFEYELGFLKPLPAFLPAPYQTHKRGIDQYGYAAFDGNYFWIPGTDRGEVKILEDDLRLRIYQARDLLIEYPLPPADVKNKLHHPDGQPQPPRQPRKPKNASQEEEKRLRALPGVGDYLDFCLQAPGVQRHVFLIRLFHLSQRMTPELFSRSAQRALRYKITSLEILERIAVLSLRDGQGELPLVHVDASFRERSSYLEGSLTDAPDLSRYDQGPD
jgi:hypothetical protein